MATLSKGFTFGASEQVTNTKLHSLVDSASISGIAATDLASAAVTTVKIADDAVDKDKLGIVTTKGDLLAYSTEPSRVAVGTNGQALVADSGETAGVKWGDLGGTPALTLSTTNAAGSASTAVRTDATIALFDATAAAVQAFGDSAATGSDANAARRDHLHGMMANPVKASDVTFGTITAGTTAADVTTVTVDEAEGVVFFMASFEKNASMTQTFQFEHPDDTAATVNMMVQVAAGGSWSVKQGSSQNGAISEAMTLIAILKPTQTGEYAIQAATSTGSKDAHAAAFWVR